MAETPKLIGGRGTWTVLGEDFAIAERIAAAIAFVGHDAAELLPLGGGDVIVVNGSARPSAGDSIARGTVDPHQLQRWVDGGADVYLHPWLHAKLIAIELGRGRRASVIGSANVSQHSENCLEEGTVVLYDAGVFAAVHSAVFRWIDDAAPVTQAWLDRAKERFRPPELPARPEKAQGEQILLSDERLLLGYAYPAADPEDPDVEAALVEERGTVADQPVEWWRCQEETEVDLQPGDTLILIELRDDENGLADLDPRRRTARPARVVRLVVSSGDTYVLFREAIDRNPTTISRLRRVLPAGCFDEHAASTDRRLNRAILDLFSGREPRRSST
ncbi:hypothetical protein [Nocardia sp. NPDC048505]|uniref:hypothetical protein n=1 Tax=unclassified Nocardia TaxID=2637762 RepID=UPI0033FE5839